MGRRPRDYRLETKEARLKLAPRAEPYWRQFHPGLFIGYRRGPGTWYMRRMVVDRYVKRVLGVADDHRDADGAEVLSYSEACGAAVQEAQDKPQRNRVAARYTVADALDDYLLARAHAKAATTTKQSANLHIRPKLGTRLVGELTAPELRAWLLGVATGDGARELTRPRKATANRVWTILRAALNHAFEEGRAASDREWRRVKPFEEADEPRVRILPVEDCRRLLNACPADFRRLARAALLTGCRYGELTAMRVRDFDAGARAVLVAEAKGGNGRWVPLTDEGVDLLEEVTAGRAGDELLFLRADGEPWQHSHQARRMKEASKVAKIKPPATFHLLRHAYGSLLARKGVSMKVIAELLGHADTRMTERHYAHLAPSDVARTLRANLPRFDEAPAKVRRMRG